MWVRFFPETALRIQILEAAARAAQTGGLSSEERERAHAAAHKLAGVLGTFGLTRGTELARELELTFSQQAAHDAMQAEALAKMAAELHTIVNSRK